MQMETVRGIDMTTFMTLSAEHQMLKGETCQPTGPPRAVSEWP